MELSYRGTHGPYVNDRTQPQAPKCDSSIVVPCAQLRPAFGRSSYSHNIASTHLRFFEMPPFVSSKVSRPTTLWFQGPLSLLSVRYVTNDVLDLIIELRTVNFAL